MDPPQEEPEGMMSPGEQALAAAGKRCASTQSQWPLPTAEPATCHRCQSEMPAGGEGAKTDGGRDQQQQQQRREAAGDASDSSTEDTSETSDTSSKVTSMLEGDARCYGDFLNEEAWLDRMLEQLGLPRPYYNEGPVSVSATGAAAAAAAAAPSAGAVATMVAGGEHHGPSSEPEKELAELSAEEYYHKELRDVLWTIVSLKLDDMRVATSQMRAAWKSYVRNSKIVDDMLQNKDRAVRQLKEQLVQLKLENKSLRERICEGSQS
ncbi:uncharacterized protein [Dermacentor albipictus]|uniref:uncharacterized protein n=1 Tax=Dermacentor albipictus TaxID=60249 RepID=UPI0031FCC1CB